MTTVDRVSDSDGIALSSAAGRRVLEVLFACAVAATLAPLWMVAHPPLQDLPQHLAAVQVLHSYADPELAFARYFELHPFRTQYLAYYFVVDLLTYVFDVRVANLLLLSVAIAATPYAVRSLARALGGLSSAGWLALPLTYNAHLILGFFNFLAAIPLALFGLALCVRLRGRFDRVRAVWLSGVAALCFLTHVVPFAFLALGCVLLAVGRPLRRTLRLVVPLAPAGLLAVAWLLRSPAGQATLSAAGGTQEASTEPVFRPVEQALLELPQWLTAVFEPGRDMRLFEALCALIVGALLVGVASGVVGALRARRNPRVWRAFPLCDQRMLALRLWLLPLAAFALYFVAPASYAWIWPIAPRFAVLSLLLCLPLLPALRVIPGTILVACAAVLTFVHVQHAAQAFEGFERDVGQFEAALEHIPKGQRVAGLIFARGSRHVRFSPFIHYVAYYQATRGGAVMFTFADFPQSPFTFRPANRPPRVPPRWEWMPGRVDPARDLSYYDYVLVRGGPGRIGHQREAFERVFRSRRWSVWRRRR